MMDDFISIRSYLNNCKQISDDNKRNIMLRKTFYHFDNHIKYLHSNNRYIKNRDMNSIMISESDPSQFNIDTVEVHNHEYAQTLKQYDIMFASRLAFTSYLSGFSEINVLIDERVVSPNFDDFSYIFHNEDVSYYRNIFVDNNFSYYSDHIDRLQVSRTSNSNGNYRGLVYSTPAGRALTDNEVGKVSLLLLIINLAIVCLVGGLLFTYLLT